MRVLHQVVQETRHASRAFLRMPAFTLVVVMTLAVGIGATTVMFAAVDGVLLRPLRYEESDRLVWVWSSDPAGIAKQRTSYPDLLDWQARTQTLELVGWGGYETSLTGTAEPLQLTAALTTGNLLGLLGVSPALGTTGRFEDGRPVEPFVVLSDGLWRRGFDQDPGVPGRTVVLNGLSYTIVGVMPPDFRFPIQASPPVDLWIPLVQFNPVLERQRGARLIEVIGRLSPGVSIGQAQAEMDAIAADLSREYLQTNQNIRVQLVPALDEVVEGASSGLRLLFWSVCGLWVIAAVNVAGLLLVRASGRRREFAIRSALGAGRVRLGLQLLTEGAIMALAGGAGGWVLAHVGVDILLAVAPEDLPRAGEIAVNGRVLSFATAISLLTGLLFALAPAWHILRRNAPLSPHGVEVTTGRRRGPAGGFLVVSEVALTMLLLTTAGLFLNSFWRLDRSDPGFDPQNVLTFSVEWPSSEHPQPYLSFRDLQMRILDIPGVEAASTGLQLPDRGVPMITDTSPFLRFEGQPIADSRRLRVSVLSIQPGYFRAMAVPVVEGRDFTAQELTEPTGVAIINESLASRYFPDGGAVGSRLILESWTLFGERPQEVVGVVGDVRHRGLTGEAQPMVYLPRGPGSGAASPVVVRTSADPLAFVDAVRDAVASVDPDRPVYDLQTLDQRIAISLSQDRFSAFLLAAVSAFGLLLSAIGLYSVVAFVMTERTREIGIRVALGATAWRALRLVLGQGIELAAAGIVIGLAGAVTLSRFFESSLFGITATDPLTYCLVGALLGLIATVACWLPARRATRVDPATALRHE